MFPSEITIESSILNAVMTFKGLRFRILPSCQINVHCAYDQLVTISTTKNLFDPNSNVVEKSDEGETTTESFGVKIITFRKTL